MSGSNALDEFLSNYAGKDFLEISVGAADYLDGRRLAKHLAHLTNIVSCL